MKVLHLKAMEVAGRVIPEAENYFSHLANSFNKNYKPVLDQIVFYSPILEIVIFHLLHDWMRLILFRVWDRVGSPSPQAQGLLLEKFDAQNIELA